MQKCFQPGEWQSTKRTNLRSVGTVRIKT